MMYTEPISNAYFKHCPVYVTRLDDLNNVGVEHSFLVLSANYDKRENTTSLFISTRDDAKLLSDYLRMKYEMKHKQNDMIEGSKSEYRIRLDGDVLAELRKEYPNLSRRGHTKRSP